MPLMGFGRAARKIGRKVKVMDDDEMKKKTLGLGEASRAKLKKVGMGNPMKARVKAADMIRNAEKNAWKKLSEQEELKKKKKLVTGFRRV